MKLLEKLKSQNRKVLALMIAVVVLVAGGGVVLAANLLDRDHMSIGSSEGITDQQAKAAALKHAGIEESNVQSMEIDSDWEDGVSLYEIRFQADGKTYEYKVQKSNGNILKSSYRSANQQKQDDNTSVQTSQPDNTQNSQTASSAGGITSEQAKEIALKHAGIQQSDTVFIRVNEDRDDGRDIYDVEFFANNTEYDYEIDRNSGEVIQSDQDIEGYSPDADTGSQQTISLEQARDLALAKVSGATVNDIRIQQERDDGKIIYEGEIHYDKMEYEFEIDGITGAFLEWSMDHWD